MICYGSGSGSDFGKMFGSVSGFVSGSRPYLAQFSKNKKIAQNLAFAMSETAYFPESWLLIFDFLTYTAYQNVGHHFPFGLEKDPFERFRILLVKNGISRVSFTRNFFTKLMRLRVENVEKV